MYVVKIVCLPLTKTLKSHLLENCPLSVHVHITAVFPRLKMELGPGEHSAGITSCSLSVHIGTWNGTATPLSTLELTVLISDGQTGVDGGEFIAENQRTNGILKK